MIYEKYYFFTWEANNIFWDNAYIRMKILLY